MMNEEKKCVGYYPQYPNSSCANRFEIERTEEQEWYDDRCDDCLRVCDLCGGVDVTETVLADPNALRIIESTDEPCYCCDCEDEVYLIPLRGYHESVGEKKLIEESASGEMILKQVRDILSQ